MTAWWESLTEEEAQSQEGVVQGEAVYGVLPSAWPIQKWPAWLREIGIVLTLNEQGGWPSELLHAIIDAHQEDRAVLVEVPFALTQTERWQTYFRVDRWWSLAQTLGFSWSLLPPETSGDDNQDDHAWSDYMSQQEAWLDWYFRRPHGDPFIFPVCHFIERWMVESQAGRAAVERHHWVDPYAQARYPSVAPKRWQTLEHRLRERLAQWYPSPKNFASTVAAAMSLALQAAEDPSTGPDETLSTQKSSSKL